MKEKFKIWLIKQPFLWKKIIFDNGISGKNYHRYDHRIFNYSIGTGNNGRNGDVLTAIIWQLNLMDKKYSLEKYLINVGIRSAEYGYEDKVLLEHVTYFKECYMKELSEYKALLFFSFYLKELETDENK